jgi:hypothetical protein
MWRPAMCGVIFRFRSCPWLPQPVEYFDLALTCSANHCQVFDDRAEAVEHGTGQNQPTANPDVRQQHKFVAAALS